MKYYFYEIIPIIITAIILYLCFFIAQKANKKIKKPVTNPNYKSCFVIKSNDFDMIQDKEDLKIVNTGSDLCNVEEVSNFEMHYYFSFCD